VLTYFALVFAISWGGFFVVVGPRGFLGTKKTSEELLPVVYLATLAPTVAGILLTALVDGRPGFRELRSRLLRWRVGFRWHLVALLTAPLLMTATLVALSIKSPVFLPAIATTDDKAGLLVTGIGVGLWVGFFEELGWTGFAIPRLRLSYGILSTGLIVGLLWGAWHFPLFSGSANSSGPVSPAPFLAVLLFSFLPPYRVLMVWVYDRTQSLLVAMLMHAPLAANQLILIPLAISGVPLITYNLVFAAAMWGVVAAVAVANRGQLSRQPLRRTVA
jgi:uncharacterized protein